MKNVLHIVFALFTSLLLGQKTFTNTYNVEPIGNFKNSNDESRVVIEHENSFYTIGTLQENKENTKPSYDGISDTTHSMLMKYDLNGGLIYTNFYTPNSCSSSIYNYIIEGDTLLAGGTIFSPKNFCGFYLIDNPPPGIDIVTKSRIYFTSTNLNSGNSKQAIYRTGISCGPFGIALSNDGNYLVANYIEDDQSICLLKINANLDSISNKKLFDSVPGAFTPIYFNKTKNGYVILLISSTGESSHFQFLNENADTTNYKDFPFVISSISKTSDNGFIAMTTETATNPRLIKFDKNLDVEWQQNYPVYATSFVKETKDGNFIIGNKDFAKVNKDSIIWTQRYFGPSNSTPWYYIFDATETSDGGFILTGYYEANTLLIKTDCMGNLVWDSNCTIIPADTVKNFGIYPNPFRDEITFQLTGVPDTLTNLRITNMLGQIIVDQKLSNTTFSLNTSSFVDGVYIYTIYSRKRVYKSGKLVKL